MYMGLSLLHCSHARGDKKPVFVAEGVAFVSVVQENSSLGLPRPSAGRWPLCFHEHGWLWMSSRREREKPGVLLCRVFSGIGVNPKGEQLQLVAVRHVCRLPATVLSAPRSWETTQWTSPGQTLMLHQPSGWKPSSIR